MYLSFKYTYVYFLSCDFKLFVETNWPHMNQIHIEMKYALGEIFEGCTNEYVHRHSISEHDPSLDVEKYQQRKKSFIKCDTFFN